MTIPQEPHVLEDYGKSYRIKVDFDGAAPNTDIDLLMIGSFKNGGTYDVPQVKVSQFESGSSLPFSQLHVPASCELIAVDE